MGPDSNFWSRQQKIRRRAPDALFWTIGFALLWMLLTGNAGWYLGLPFVLAAAWLAVALELKPWRLRLSRLPGFILFFLTFSLLGAWDVARRTLLPGHRIRPGWTEYSMQTQDPRQQLLFSAIIGLLPGTLAARIDGQQMKLHLLDTDADWMHGAQRLERHLMQLLPEIAT